MLGYSLFLISSTVSLYIFLVAIVVDFSEEKVCVVIRLVKRRAWDAFMSESILASLDDRVRSPRAWTLYLFPCLRPKQLLKQNMRDIAEGSSP